MNTMVQGFYAAYARSDSDGMVRHVTPELVLHVPGSHELAGTYRGLERALGFMAACHQRTQTMYTEVGEVLVGPTHAAVSCVVHATRPGRVALANHVVHWVRLADDGRVAEIWLHNRDQRSVDVFWA